MRSWKKSGAVSARKNLEPIAFILLYMIISNVALPEVNPIFV
jgi:hypothetical protein